MAEDVGITRYAQLNRTGVAVAGDLNVHRQSRARWDVVAVDAEREAEVRLVRLDGDAVTLRRAAPVEEVFDRQGEVAVGWRGEVKTGRRHGIAHSELVAARVLEDHVDLGRRVQLLCVGLNQ